jgi:LacI family transcriptional regulator
VLARLPAAVLINRRLDMVEDDTFQSVILDDERGGWLATQHLLQRGHTCIGFLAGPPNSFSAQGRRKGYLAALETHGIRPEPGWMAACQPTVEGGQYAARCLLEQRPELTALFCFNDLVAVGALQACAEFGRRVPEDMAVVGHDDIPLAGLVSPALTSCRVQRRELGSQAVDALLERLKECPGGCRQIVLQPELIIRQSAP